MVKEPVSLYFHIPFCTRKCDYCHFFVLPDKEEFKVALMQGLKKEWELRLPYIQDKEIISVYFGGGTPSLLGVKYLEEILSWVFKLGNPKEITLEANPEYFSKDLFSGYKAAGVNRLSIGVQSFDNALLHRLSRTHDANQAEKAILGCFDLGLTNVSIDLMYDLPGQSIESWKETLKKATELPITHLSLYNLTIEPHTSFFKKKAELKKQIPDEETSLEMYLSAISTFENAGLMQYEISAFARNNQQSLHNTGYWTGRSFLGFGPSAFSYWKGSRFRNVANLNKYNKALQENQFPVDFEEALDPEAKTRELLAVNLRLVEGVNIEKFNLTKETIDVIEKLKQENFLCVKGSRLALTQRGILFYDLLASEII